MEQNKKLPKIAMGAWAWGDKDGYFGNTMTGEEFRPIFNAAMNADMNLWDTATAYSNGESEKILGGFVNDAGRGNVIVSTKFTPQMAEMYGDSVVKMCEASLERMNMEYFDIYWIHNPIGAPKYTKQLIPLLKDGRVKSVGKIADIVLTADEIAALEAAADKSGVTSIQFWESKME
ncbi:MAG: aldo/keto reductase [Eubacterium sp.]|nr:aldo/keto reductase [Eubacterium sp.]